MSNNTEQPSSESLIQQLRKLHISTDESRVYIELLRGPQSHLQLANATGINRTKIYRLADQLEKRSLITTRTDGDGTFLVAADPATLEVSLVTQEEMVKEQRSAFEKLLPLLTTIKDGEASDFVVHSYEGERGFKQMLWHELKGMGTIYVFGSGTLEDLVSDRRWCEAHRQMSREASYTIRELLNPGGKPPDFTSNQSFMETYSNRVLPPEVLKLTSQMVIYNNTVAIYHWRKDQKVGTEIVNAGYADMMRQVFDTYWEISEKYRGVLHL